MTIGTGSDGVGGLIMKRAKDAIEACDDVRRRAHSPPSVRLRPAIESPSEPHRSRELIAELSG